MMAQGYYPPTGYAPPPNDPRLAKRMRRADGYEYEDEAASYFGVGAYGPF